MMDSARAYQAYCDVRAAGKVTEPRGTGPGCGRAGWCLARLRQPSSGRVQRQVVGHVRMVSLVRVRTEVST